MGLITALTRQKRNPDRVNVFVDGQFVLGVAAIAAAGLKVGQPLTPADLERLQEADRLEAAQQTAVRFIGFRPRSIAEVRRNLAGKAYSAGVIDTVVDRLQSVGLLDDKAFARYWVEQRETFKPRSQIALRQELQQKGVSRQVIDQVIDAVDETEAARRAAANKARSLRTAAREEFMRKLGGFLQRRGFNYEIVRQVTGELWREQSAGNSSDADSDMDADF